MCGTAQSVSTLLIVDGLPKAPGDGREGRLDPRLAAAPLQRVHQPRLLAADVRAGAEVERDVESCPLPITSLPA
jgi:hypothetical protein